jgi:hypothetical protein
LFWLVRQQLEKENRSTRGGAATTPGKRAGGRLLLGSPRQRLFLSPPPSHPSSTTTTTTTTAAPTTDGRSLLSPKSNSIDNVDEKESSFVSPTTFVYKPGSVSKSRLLRRHHQQQLQSPRSGVVAEEEEDHHDHTHGRRILDQPPMKTPPPTIKNKHRLLSTGAKRVPVGVRHHSPKATAIQQQQQQQQQSTSRRRMGYDGTIYTPSKHLLQSTAASRHQRYNDTATAATTTSHHRMSLDDDDGMDEDSPQLSSSNNPSLSSHHDDVDGSMESFWEHVARNQKNADDPSIFSNSSTTPPRGELHDINSSIIKERNLNCTNPMAWTLQQCLSNEHDDDQQQEQETCCTTTSNEVDDGDCNSEMKSPIKRVTSNLQHLYGLNKATATTIIPRPIPHKPTTITRRQLMLYIR